MSGTYHVTYHDPWGRQIAVLDAARLELVRRVNDVGALILDLPARYERRGFRPDARLLVWRSLGGRPPSLVGETMWLVRKISRALDAQGEVTTRLEAADANDLLRRRFVAYSAGSSFSAKGGPADDLMKAIARENFGALASDPARSWASLLAVEPNRSQGATVDKGFARREVLRVLAELAEASTQAGTYLAFDVVVSDPKRGALEFRTFAHARGTDHRWPASPAPVLVGPAHGTLADVTLTYDYTDEATFVYAAGQGTDEARMEATASDAERIGASPFGRIEWVQDARQAATADALADEAMAALRARRPRRLFSGRLLSTPGRQWGVHYDFGDIVTAEFDGERLDCRVDALRVTVEGGVESVDVQLRGEEG